MLTEQQEKELAEVCNWTNVSGDKLERLYAIYRVITGDSGHLCNRCPAVIRKVFNRVKTYYITNYSNKK